MALQTHAHEIILNNRHFKWIDLVHPTKKYLEDLAKEYSIHPKFLKDCLEPEHLPKIERLGSVLMIIMRSYDETTEKDANNVQDLTRKIVIFYSDKFLITIHRKDQKLIKEIRDRWHKILAASEQSTNIEKSDPGRNFNQTSPIHEQMILHDLIESVVHSYQDALDTNFEELEKLESQIIQNHTTATSDLTNSYYFKRRISVIKRMVRVQLDMSDKITAHIEVNLQPYYKHLQEQFSKLYFYADDLSENIQALVNLQISLASQTTNESSFRINEISRLLTLFSVYFLPLNFIVGIYGMNFKFMPELDWELGYPFALIIMGITAISLYWWTKKKGWL